MCLFQLKKIKLFSQNGHNVKDIAKMTPMWNCLT